MISVYLSVCCIYKVFGRNLLINSVTSTVAPKEQQGYAALRLQNKKRLHPSGLILERSAYTHPLCSQIWVKSDSWVGGDASWMTGLIMRLTVYFPCPDLAFKHLSITQTKTSVGPSVTKRTTLLRTSQFILCVAACWRRLRLVCLIRHCRKKSKKIYAQERFSHPSQDLKLRGKVLTGSTPGSVKIQHPVISTWQNQWSEGLWSKVHWGSG